MIKALRFLLVALAAWIVLPATAHEISMAEMEIREIAPGEFLRQWTASGTPPAGDELTPVWPDGCRASGNTLSCGPEGRSGSLAVDGVGQRYSAALVKSHWPDGQSRVYTVTTAQPTVRLYGSAEDRWRMGEIASAYGVLGVKNILGGIDHLLFVLALLLRVGFNRRLVWTITAFTVARSVTLALSALGWPTLRPPLVEATIALSISGWRWASCWPWPWRSPCGACSRDIPSSSPRERRRSMRSEVSRRTGRSAGWSQSWLEHRVTRFSFHHAAA